MSYLNFYNLSKRFVRRKFKFKYSRAYVGVSLIAHVADDVVGSGLV